jgi:hypothetical protein
MVVDPLMINTMQSQTCRDCRDNREARAWAAGKTVSYQIVESSRVDDELGSKNFACCSHTMTQGEVKYTCPVFPKLIEGYNAGLTSQGTNLNPCKHCVEHMDNGGRCIGDRCPDGTFDIKEGAGIIRC